MTKLKKPLYVRKANVNTHKKLDTISKKLNVPKWLVADQILAMSLGVKNENSLDLSRWLKLK